jgi:hypothetical protein
MWCKYYTTYMNLDAADDPWHLGSLLYHCSLFTLYFTNLLHIILCKTRHYAYIHVTFGALVHNAHLLAMSYTHEAAGLDWPVFVTAAVQSLNVCCCCTRPANQAGGAEISSFSVFSQNCHQESDILVRIFCPTRK